MTHQDIVDVKSGDQVNSICQVCNDILPVVKMWTGSVKVKRLKESAEQGCDSCHIIWEGLSLFWSHNSIFPDNIIDEVDIQVWEQSSTFQVEVFSKRVQLYDLHFYTLPGAPSKWTGFKVSEHMPIALNLRVTTKKISKWLIACEQLHEKCHTHASRLPSRIIDVGLNTGPISLRLAEGGDTIANYMTLSHCWGDLQLFSTTMSNLKSHYNDVPWKTLPKTFRDAIEITRALEIRYLWIDSLCIVQDDYSDWEKEAKTMASLYSHSFLNLAATGAKNSAGGLFLRRWNPGSEPDSKLPNEYWEVKDRFGHDSGVYIRLAPTTSHVDLGFVLGSASPCTPFQSAPLSTRAWAYQESLLSARTVYFHSAEMVWQCTSTAECECAFLHNEYKNRWSVVLPEPSGVITEFSLSMYRNPQDDWYKVVERYSALRITKPEDILPALSGVASRFAPIFGNEYVAGIWKTDILKGLLWSICHPIPPSPVHRSRHAPSWSWASIELSSHQYETRPQSVIHRSDLILLDKHVVLNGCCRPKGENPFGAVSQGFLEVVAPHVVLPCELWNLNLESNKSVVSYINCNSKLSNDSYVQISLDETLPTEPTNDSRIKFPYNDLICILLGRDEWSRDLGLLLQAASKISGRFERVGMVEINYGAGSEDSLFSDAPVSSFTVI